MKDEIPGYVTEENYDIMRNKAYKADQKIEALELRVKDLEKDLQQALFIKADHISKELDAASEGEAKLIDQKMLTDFVINSLKLKPRQVIFKWKGSIIMEIIPKQ